MKDTIALILAAGKGTRMKSRLPKVLHRVGGVPMVEQVLRTVKAAGTRRQIVVVGFGGEMVQEYLGNEAETVMQKEQLGTGHAVLQAEALLKDEQGTLLVTCGDTPLVTKTRLYLFWTGMKRAVLRLRSSQRICRILPVMGGLSVMKPVRW